MNESAGNWLPAVAQYIHVLASSLESTTHSGDRTLYRDHLAAAAQLIPLLTQTDRSSLAEWIEAETHSWGWSYLSGDEGEAAERAFVTLTEALSEYR